jgi:hypothetical protein
MEVEERLPIKWVAFYALVSVWRRGEMKKHVRVRLEVRRGDERGRTMRE